MTAALTAALQDVRGQASQLDLSSDPAPAIAIHLTDAEILAANAKGAEAFGLFPYAEFPIALDPALPAFVRLRQFVAAQIADAASKSATIVWSAERHAPVTCKVTRHGKKGSQIFLLHVIDDETQKVSVAPKPVSEILPAPPLPEIPSAQPSRLDAGALKEIARQIRESELSARPADDALAIAPSRTPAGVENIELPAKALAKPIDPLAAPPQRKAVALLDPDHLAKLAHELKTPLTAIAAAAEVMRDERLGAMGNERYLSYAADIHESATHALDVITSLLSESGRPGAAPSRLIALDLNAIVTRTVSSVQALAQSRGLTLAFDADGTQPHVIANPTAVRQILLNLLTNAIKFTPRDGDVRVATGYLNDGRVFMVVRDTGRGMKGKPFAPDATGTADTHLHANGRGHGIGLPLVQRLVREMGADIEIDSAPGKGTVVLIAFGGFARWSA